MKKNMLILSLVTISFFAACSKEQQLNASIQLSQTASQPVKDDTTCVTLSAKGRIIGFDPTMSFLNFDTSRFINYDPTLGPGYLVEIDNALTRDTVITYRIKTNNFTFSPSHDRIASFYLFKPEFQDSLKIKFNYTTVIEKTVVFAVFNTGGTESSRWFYFLKNRKEVALSCVSNY